MFKQTYKEINDSIPVNDELLKKLLIEAKKPVKVVKFKNVYKYGLSVAAAFILALTAIAFPSLKVSDVQNRAKTKSIAISDAKEEHVGLPDAENTNNKAKETEASPGGALEESEKQIAFDVESGYDAASADEANHAALARTIGIPDGFEEILIDEYLEEFGFDLSGIALPDGVKRVEDTLLSERDENGNLVFSEHVIAYMSEDGKYLNLTITPNLDFVKEMISLYPGKTVFGEDGYIGAYVLKENGGYIVDCYNFSVNEVEALTSSLK